jgi:hypothetical protein
MAGRGARVGVIVIAVREIRAAIEEDPKAAFAELVAIALEVVGPELVDYDHDHELGASIVGGRGGARGRNKGDPG